MFVLFVLFTHICMQSMKQTHTLTLISNKKKKEKKRINIKIQPNQAKKL